jgi:hypothetical protein
VIPGVNALLVALSAGALGVFAVVGVMLLAARLRFGSASRRVGLATGSRMVATDVAIGRDRIAAGLILGSAVSSFVIGMLVIAPVRVEPVVFVPSFFTGVALVAIAALRFAPTTPPLLPLVFMATLGVAAVSTASAVAAESGWIAGPFSPPTSATTAVPAVRVTLTIDTAGLGEIHSDPTAIACPPTCRADLVVGTRVTLRATAPDASLFDGWGAACSGTDTCTLTVERATVVRAAFVRAATVSVDAQGRGTVVSTPAGINCPPSCTGKLPLGSVTLTAQPASDSIFVGWKGGCGGTVKPIPQCALTLSRNEGLTVVFAIPTLTVAKAGAGSGIVASPDAAITCGTKCSSPFSAGTRISLQAIPTRGSTFGGWAGDCQGSQTCAVELDQFRTVAATFDSFPTIGYGAAPCGESAFVQVRPGDLTQLTFCFTNTGTNGWVRGSGSQVNIAACCPANVPPPHASWVVNPISNSDYATTSMSVVTPGQSGLFAFNVRVPKGTAPGEYVFEVTPVVAASGAPMKSATLVSRVRVTP